MKFAIIREGARLLWLLAEDRLLGAQPKPTAEPSLSLGQPAPLRLDAAVLNQSSIIKQLLEELAQEIDGQRAVRIGSNADLDRAWGDGALQMRRTCVRLVRARATSPP